MRKIIFAISFIFSLIIIAAHAQPSESVTEAGFINLNKPERLEWFKGLGFGMFIHFCFDSQLGIVISHSMVGASEDYLNRYVNESPCYCVTQKDMNKPRGSMRLKH